MHLQLLALTYWLKFITVFHYTSKQPGWPRDEKANQYSQYLPPLISVACVSLAICNRSQGLGALLKTLLCAESWLVNGAHGGQAQPC